LLHNCSENSFGGNWKDVAEPKLIGTTITVGSTK